MYEKVHAPWVRRLSQTIGSSHRIALSRAHGIRAARYGVARVGDASDMQ